MSSDDRPGGVPRGGACMVSVAVGVDAQLGDFGVQVNGPDEFVGLGLDDRLARVLPAGPVIEGSPEGPAAVSHGQRRAAVVVVVGGRQVGAGVGRVEHANAVGQVAAGAGVFVAGDGL